jgi:hypothetical protein
MRALKLVRARPITSIVDRQWAAVFRQFHLPCPPRRHRRRLSLVVRRARRQQSERAREHVR